jgi:DNA repair protein RadC
MQIATKPKINPEAISRLPDHALLAILLTSDRRRYFSLEQSTEILKVCQNSLKRLLTEENHCLTISSCMCLSDLIKLRAAMELTRRIQIAEVLEKPKITNSNDVYEFFRHLADLQYEEFWVVVLNRANRVIDRQRISEGGVSGTVVDIKRIYHRVLELLGTGLILVHNHPSGNVQPSENDKQITRKIKEAGKLFNVAVLDHLIVGQGQYYSFADEGNL